MSRTRNDARVRWCASAGLAAVALLLMSWGAPAMARTPRGRAAEAACQSDYRDAVKAERAGHLLESARLFESCDQPRCGATVRRQCAARATQVASDTPSVVPFVTDAAGNPKVDVRVTMDGELLTDRVDGRAIPVDPGMHRFTVRRSDGLRRSRNVMILEGQRNRAIGLSLGSDRGDVRDAQRDAPGDRDRDRGDDRDRRDDRDRGDDRDRDATGDRRDRRHDHDRDRDRPAARDSRDRDRRAAIAHAAVGPTPPGLTTHRSSSAPGYLFIATGVVGVGGYALLSYWGRKDNDLLARCSPNCQQSDVDHIHSLYLAADVSLAAGATALVAGTWMLWRSHSTYTIEVHPTGTGGMASVAGRF